MSADMTIAVTAGAVGSIVVFYVGYALGYAARIHEEREAWKNERIRSALKHWHGYTTRRGHTIVAPDMPTAEAAGCPQPEPATRAARQSTQKEKHTNEHQ